MTEFMPLTSRDIMKLKAEAANCRRVADGTEADAIRQALIERANSLEATVAQWESTQAGGR